MTIDYDAGSLIPDYMRGGMQRYIEDRIQPGSFLTAVLANDLMLAAAKADDTNRHRLFEYVVWLHNHAPPSCYGSWDAVRNWINHELRG